MSAYLIDSTGREEVDVRDILKNYGGNRIADFYTCYGRANTTGLGFTFRSVAPLQDDSYWGTDEGWKTLNSEILTAEEFDEVAQYLRETGQASA